MEFQLFQILKDDSVKVLHSIAQQIWKTQQRPQDWKRSVFIPTPKKGNAKECWNCCIIALISQSSKVMLIIPHARLQWYVNWELPDVQAGFRKGRGTRDQIAKIHWIIEKAREFQKKTSTSVSLTMLKILTAWITTNCGKFLKRWKSQTTLPGSWETCMQAKKQQDMTGHETMDWFQIWKGAHQSHIFSACLFNLYAEYIMWNARLDESQGGLKITGRNISNFR